MQLFLIHSTDNTTSTAAKSLPGNAHSTGSCEVYTIKLNDYNLLTARWISKKAVTRWKVTGFTDLGLKTGLCGHCHFFVLLLLL